ncbi:hypothetical protein [Halorhabdus salina]|uniref:hypothetical protein n=1 Tax=Halorhabdus salina TaxID=2750670 RepID=UPI0015EEDB74|nr:hypothetical protein [Halorhabdus salina]
MELNDGNWANHTGTLADGETITLTGNASWLQSGTNTVNVSMPSLSADAPPMQVDLEYSHDASDRISTLYSSTKWTEYYNVSRTYSSDRSNPTLSIPFESSIYSIGNIEYRTNGGTWQTPSYSLDSGTMTVSLPDVSAGDKVTVRTTGRQFAVENGQITVTDPTLPTDPLDSKIRVESRSAGDLILGVGETSTADRIHYTYNETWTGADERMRFDSGGSQSLVLPTPEAGDEFRVTTIPVEVHPSSGDVVVSAVDPSQSEPTFDVSPGAQAGDPVEFRYLNAQTDEKYLLYSLDNSIVRDSGVASSPITLEDDDSDETLRFQVENTSSSGSDTGGGGGIIGAATGGGGISLSLTGPVTIVTIVGALLVLWYVSRKVGIATGGPVRWTTSKITTAGGSLARRPSALIGLIAVGSIVAAVLGWLPVELVAPPIAVSLIIALYAGLRRLDLMNWPVFGLVAGLISLATLEIVSPGVIDTLTSQAATVVPLLILGGVALLWRYLQRRDIIINRGGGQ